MGVNPEPAGDFLQIVLPRIIEKTIFLSRLPPTRYARGSICFYSNTRGSRGYRRFTTALLAVARRAHKLGGRMPAEILTCLS